MANSPVVGSNGLLDPTTSRMSMQSTSRPHLSTTMSTAGVSSKITDTGPVSATPTSVTQGATIEQSVKLFKVFEALRNGDNARSSL